MARYVTGGDTCLPQTASGVAAAPFVDQNLGRGIGFGTPVAAGKWGFVTGCTTTGAAQACEELVPTVLPLGSTVTTALAGLTAAQVAAALGPGAVPMEPCAPGNHAVCRIDPWSAYYPMNAAGQPRTERLLRTRACCLKEGAVFDPSDGAMHAGCAPNACAGTDTCRALAAGEWCRELSADGSPARWPDAPPNGAADDALCRALGTWGEDGKAAHDAVMLEVCFDRPDGGPSRWFRQPGCTRWCTENFEQCKAAGLEAFCAAHFRSDAPTGDFGVPEYNDICACAYGPDVYDRYFGFLRDEYNIPPSMLDARPMCSFPGCSASRVPDLASVASRACPAINMNICSQRIVVDNRGTIGDVEITASCQQYVQPNDGAACDPAAAVRTCPTSQQCDAPTGKCRPPENATTPCSSKGVCADGWACGAEGLCVPADQVVGGLPVWLGIVLCVLAGCAVGAVLLGLLAAWRRAKGGGAA